MDEWKLERREGGQGEHEGNLVKKNKNGFACSLGDYCHDSPWIKETIFHFLLMCPHYAYIRGKLLLTLHQHIVSIPFLLGDPTGIPHFLRFVSDTKRLRATFGEVRPADDFKIKSKSELQRPQLQLVDEFEDP